MRGCQDSNLLSHLQVLHRNLATITRRKSDYTHQRIDMLVICHVVLVGRLSFLLSSTHLVHMLSVCRYPTCLCGLYPCDLHSNLAHNRSFAANRPLRPSFSAFHTRLPTSQPYVQGEAAAQWFVLLEARVEKMQHVAAWRLTDRSGCTSWHRDNKATIADLVNQHNLCGILKARLETADRVRA
jgi:hypothetical protein